MKDVDYMPMYPHLDPGTEPQNNLFLHFHEQLDELIPLEDQLPHSVRLTLFQTAVRSVPELRIVETIKSICL